MKGRGVGGRHFRWAALIAALVFLTDALNLFGDKIGLAQGGFMLEDGFYYLTLARRFIHGQGFTLDGVHATTGFHPLHLLLLCPLAWLKGDWAFMRATVGLCALYHAAAAALLFLLLSRVLVRRTAVVLSLLWALAASVRQCFLNGMETGLFIVMALAVLFAFELRRTEDDPRRLLPVGLLLGLAYWARTDALFVGAGLSVVVAFGRMSRKTQRLAWLWVPAFAVALPWLSVSAAYTGRVFPESGAASRRLGVELGDGYLRDHGLAEFGKPGLIASEPGVDRGLRYMAASALLACTWAPPFAAMMGWQHPFFWDGWEEYPFTRFARGMPIVAWTAFLVLLLGATWGWTRLGLGAVPVSAVLVWLAYAWLPGPSWFFIRYNVWFSLFVGVGSVLAAIRVMEGWNYRRYAQVLLILCGVAYVHQFWQLFPRRQEPAGYLKEAFWAQEYLPHGSVVATFQGGVFSFFSGLDTVNLDGVVNNEALSALQAGDLAGFLAEADVDYLADADGLVHHFLSEIDLRRVGIALTKIRAGFFGYYRVTKLASSPSKIYP